MMSTFWSGVAALALFASATGGVTALAGTDRPDCPGKIECPRTGEVICRDQCPELESDPEPEADPRCGMCR